MQCAWQSMRLARAASAGVSAGVPLLTKKFLDSVGEPMWEIRHRRIGHGARPGDARALRDSERRDEVMERRAGRGRAREDGLALQLAARNLPWSPNSITPATDLATVCTLHSRRRRCSRDVWRWEVESWRDRRASCVFCEIKIGEYAVSYALRQ